MENALSAYRELGPKRYRETSGLYYEDFEVGDVFEHRPGRTIGNAGETVHRASIVRFCRIVLPSDR